MNSTCVINCEPSCDAPTHPSISPATPSVTTQCPVAPLVGNIPKLGMTDPVPSGIRGEGKVSYVVFVNFVVEVEESTEASVRKDVMCRFGENVIVRKTFFSGRESFRFQVLLDGEVRVCVLLDGLSCRRWQ
jgi:hypothetical protein